MLLPTRGFSSNFISFTAQGKKSTNLNLNLVCFFFPLNGTSKGGEEEAGIISNCQMRKNMSAYSEWVCCCWPEPAGWLYFMLEFYFIIYLSKWAEGRSESKSNKRSIFIKLRSDLMWVEECEGENYILSQSNNFPRPCEARMGPRPTNPTRVFRFYVEEV